MQGPLFGACASSVDEARLSKEEFKGEVHAFAAGFSDEDMRELLTLCDHITFNSINQWKKFRPVISEYNEKHEKILCGLRINPEHSEGAVPIYDPCSPSSRLGIRLKDFENENLDELFDGLTGLHFHTLCEQIQTPLTGPCALSKKNSRSCLNAFLGSISGAVIT